MSEECDSGIYNEQCGCGACGAECKKDAPDSILNAKPHFIDRLFNEAHREVESETMKRYKDMIKSKMKEKKAAELLLGNINRELEDLRLKIIQEVV